MKEGQKLWTREELILAVNLYCKLPFCRLHRLNPEVIHLANLIGRTSSSVAYKLVKFFFLNTFFFFVLFKIKKKKKRKCGVKKKKIISPLFFFFFFFWWAQRLAKF